MRRCSGRGAAACFGSGAESGGSVEVVKWECAVKGILKAMTRRKCLVYTSSQ